VRKVTSEVKYCDKCPLFTASGGHLDDKYYPFIAQCSEMGYKIIMKHKLPIREQNIEIPNWCPFEEVE